ncbi:uncharacterized protein LOC115219239 isoform X3 [Octopus sinensis]|uniref:Uncharacterized protein LOC115219239 isoform X3 n=1 Tax=Octopus sinensis TaxID=2607531 RepID=A0A6P7T3D6_9MOLL|nr:uncharacterized protein LOC115219239 isoform X3 [Octopus sinensis]
MSRPKQPSRKMISTDIIDDEEIRQETWTFSDLFQQTSTKDTAMMWLAKYKLISNSFLCPTCSNPCSFVTRNSGGDGKRWSCRKHNFVRSVRKGSFFENSHLSLTTFLWFMYMWSRNYLHNEITFETDICTTSSIDLFRLIRELLERFLEDHPTEIDDAPEIGGFDLQTGEPKVVEIDITTFSRSKSNKRHLKGFRVFGGIERGTDKCFLVPIEHENKDAFEAAIIRWILPGTHIISDIWAEYLQIDQIEQGIYTHEYIDYENPNDPEIHIQNISKMWLRFRQQLRRRHSINNKALFYSHLTEFMWRSHFKNNDKFAALIYCIKHLYKV